MSLFQPFTGSRHTVWLALGVGLLGLSGTAAGFVQNPAHAYHSYLLAFAYWVSISLGTLVMLCTFHASGAVWMTVLRRQMETIASGLTVGVLLFLPLLTGMKHLYVWADTEKAALGLHGHAWELMRHKAPFLNMVTFVVGTLLCFGTWALVSELLFKWSRDQDTRPGDEQPLKKMRALAAPALVAIALTMSFAALAWLMSLEPLWFSSMYGVYYFAGSFLAAFAMVTLVTVVPEDERLQGAYVSEEHLHNLGKLQLAFTAFWAYIVFSQFLIIWHANQAEEAPFFLARGLSRVAPAQAFGEHRVLSHSGDAWWPVSLFLMLFHFALPFLFFLSSAAKKSRKYLAFMSVWLLLVHYIDLFWAVMPAKRLVTPALTAPSLEWTDVTAFFGVGGISVAFVWWRMHGRYAVPVNDPALGASLRYQQP